MRVEVGQLRIIRFNKAKLPQSYSVLTVITLLLSLLCCDKSSSLVGIKFQNNMREDSIHDLTLRNSLFESSIDCDDTFPLTAFKCTSHDNNLVEEMFERSCMPMNMSEIHASRETTVEGFGTEYYWESSLGGTFQLLKDSPKVSQRTELEMDLPNPRRFSNDIEPVKLLPEDSSKGAEEVKPPIINCAVSEDSVGSKDPMRIVKNSEKCKKKQKGKRKTYRRNPLIRQVLDDVETWMSYRRGELGGKRLNATVAAEKLKLKKKTLDDYSRIVKLGKRYKFLFSENLEKKIGVLRNFVERHHRPKQIFQILYCKRLI